MDFLEVPTTGKRTPGSFPKRTQFFSSINGTMAIPLTPMK
jgi:hypothetical protein